LLHWVQGSFDDISSAAHASVELGGNSTACTVGRGEVMQAAGCGLQEVCARKCITP
jgi:hypothetical protein